MQIPNITLNDKHRIPQLGFGTWMIENDKAEEAVQSALKAGYRHIDTAKIYGNEEGIGRALAECDIEREKLYITTKLWNEDQGYDSGLRAFETSLKKLKLDYVDLYLIHWPCPTQGRYLETWRALIRLHEQGLAKSIGVSNFRIQDLKHIIGVSGIVPAVNQIELHPYYQQTAQRAFHKKHNITTESYSPLGRGTALQDPVLQKIAKEHGKTAGQIILRWHIELGNIPIPKSRTESRIRENTDIFNFSLTEADKAAIAELDKKDGRILPDPAERNTSSAL